MARNSRHIDLANARALLLRGHVLQQIQTERGIDFVIPGGGPVTAVVARRLLSDPHCRAVDRGLFTETPQSWTLARCRK
jgi:hypothetical protein